MKIDIFPAINLPVVMVVWSYPGLNAIDGLMAQRRIWRRQVHELATRFHPMAYLGANAERWPSPV
jgi:hypothetical protein